MSRYAYKMIYSWNSDLAYLTGLFASDGCLSKDERHLNVTSKDWEIIEIVQNIANTHGKVPLKKSGYGGEAYNLQFGNVALYDFFLSIGLTPAKSKTIGPLHIPDKYYADFLRGYFDGDGTVYGYWDPRWPKSLMYYTGFTSASPQFIAWLQHLNQELAQTTSGRIKPSTRAATLSYAKADSQKLFSFMYHSKSVPRLSRKYAKFVAFLDADPYPIRS